MVYALMLERIDRQVQAERQVAAVFMAAGAKKVELPDYEQSRERFDAALFADPTVSTERDELLRELGLRA